jgi:hypothetical protein
MISYDYVKDMYDLSIQLIFLELGITTMRYENEYLIFVKHVILIESTLSFPEFPEDIIFPLLPSQ